MAAFMKINGAERAADNGYGMRLVRATSFGRKRVALSNICIDFGGDDDDADSIPRTAPQKRSCSRDSFSSSDVSSALEDLPQEILIRILCGVEHADLKSLLLVSKTMKDAAVIAKQTHFAFSTPRKTTKFEENEVETPEAPKQLSRAERRRMVSSKKLVGISVSLFATDHSKCVRPLLLEMETSNQFY